MTLEDATNACAILLALKRTVPAEAFVDGCMARAEEAAVDRMPHAML